MIKWLVEISAIALLFYGTGKLELLTVTLSQTTAAVFPTSGISLGLLLLVGTRAWPGVWLGAFCLNIESLMALPGLGLFSVILLASCLALNSSLQTLVGAVLVKRVIGIENFFDHSLNIFKFVSIALAISFFESTLGSFVLCVTGLIPWISYVSTWWTWWLVNFIGDLVFVPILLLLAKPFKLAWRKWQSLEAFLLTSLLLLACFIVFRENFALGKERYPIGFCLIPLHLWAAFRFGARGVALSILVVLVIAIWGSAENLGIFAQNNLTRSLLLTQAYLGVATFTGLILATAIEERRRAQEALRKSEESYRVTFEMAGVGKLQVNPSTGQFLRVNSRFCEMTGYCQEELLQKTFIDITHTDDIAWSFREFKRFTAGEMTEYIVETRFVRKDGQIIWVWVNATLLYDSLGHPERTITVVEDVTARKQAEEALRVSRERLELTQQSAKVVSWEWDSTGDTITFHSGGVGMLYGFEPDNGEVNAQVIRNLFHPDDKAKIAEWKDKIFRSDSDFDFQHRVIWHDGSMHWIGSIGRIIRYNAAKGVRLVGVSMEITDRKVAEAALHDSEARLRLAVDATALGTFDHNLLTDKLICSDRYKEIMGMALDEEATFEQLVRAIHPDDREVTLLPALEKARSPAFQGRFRTEFRVIRSKGKKEQWIEACGQTYFDCTGKPIRVIGTVHDITAKKEAERDLRAAKEAAEAANRAKSNFLSNMSHEIRTPLNAILGFAELLRDAVLTDEEKRQFIDIVSRNGEQLIQLIDDILDLSKVEAGHLQIERLELPLAEFLTEAVSFLQLRAKSKGVHLALHLSKQLPMMIVSDPTRLRQILINIIGNAIKFTSQAGRVDVHVALEKSGDVHGEPKIKITVSDTGCGIDEEHRDSLFQPFTQADSSTTRKYGGTGLGLVLSRRLARALGGDVELLESRRGLGSTFAITVDPGTPLSAQLFAEELYSSPKTLNSLGKIQEEQPLKNKLILVVEDTIDTRLLVKRFLKLTGAEVELAVNGEEAIAKASMKEYDAILMDIGMPVLDGYEATKQLRKQGYRRPIIALTAHAMKEERDKCIGVGCDDYLTKPLDQKLVISRLVQFTKRI